MTGATHPDREDGVRPRLLVLGPVTVAGGHGEQVARGARSRELLVALALESGRPVATTTLVDALWDDELVDRPRAALQSVVSRARRDVGPEIIESVAEGYRLAVASDIGDVERLADTADVALASGDAADALTDARAALAEWRGDPGADLAPGSAIGPRLIVRAARLRGRLTHVLCAALLAVGDTAGAIEVARGSIEADPLNEQAALDLMRALDADGQVTEALRVFGALRERLGEELGIDPSPEVRALHEDLLRAEAPPERPARRVASVQSIGLRSAPTRLIGREEDVAEIESALKGSRLVTILGAGGMGKTRLAFEVAHRAADAGTQVVFVELAAAGTDADVDLVLASTLGVREPTAPGRPRDPSTHRSLRERVLAHLSSPDVLLVLDNCEHVLDAAARWATDLLAETPARILATSRSPLAVAGEQAYPARALAGGASGSAVELFVERARAARPDVDLPPELVARLCERLDGLPLAIELAAVRVRSMSVEEIERRLASRFVLLTRGDRSAPERHRTLLAVLEWSWNLLSVGEQSLLRRTSLLVDGFDLEAAQSLAANADELLDEIDGLVRQSLLAVEPSGQPGAVRYRMLETVREFGAMQLDRAGERAAALRAVEDWAAELAGRLRHALTGEGQIAAMARISDERDNLVHALRSALADGRGGVVAEIMAVLAMTGTMQGAHEEVGSLGASALPVLGPRRVPPEHRDAAAHGLLFIAITLLFMDRRAGRRAVALLRTYARLPEDLNERTRTLVSWVTARDLADVAQRGIALRDHPDAYVAMLASMAIAAYAENAGRFEEAEAAARVGHRRATEIGDTWGMAMSATFLAQVFNEAGRADEVAVWAGRARDGLALLGAEGDLAQADLMEVGSAITLGDVDRAVMLIERLERANVSTSARWPDFPPGELTAAISAARAELAWLAGDREAAVAAFRAGEGTLSPETQPWTPWLLLHHATRLCFLVLSGIEPGDQVARHARRLRGRTRAAARRAQPPYAMVDSPLLGTVAISLGAYLWSTPELGRQDDGLELLALAGRLGSRQDLPSLSRARHDAVARERLGDTAVDAAAGRAAAAASPIERAMELIDRPGWG